MNDQNYSGDGHIVREFLKNPLSHDAFKDFFNLSVQLTVGFLAFLNKKGYRLPKDLYAAENHFYDLANDILGSLLISKPNHPYALVSDFFNLHTDGNIDTLSTKMLFKLYKSLLFSFTRQELSRLKKDLDPQVENLKQRFKAIFRGEAYEVYHEDSNSTALVKLYNANENDSPNLPIITYHELLQLVEDAYHNSKTRTQWCKNIFVKIYEMKNVRKSVKLHEILRAVVAINSKYSLSGSFSSSIKDSLDYSPNKELVLRAKSETLDWLSNNVVKKLIDKNKINRSIGQSFLKAADIYISDLLFSADTDGKVIYFREVMPKDFHDRYSDYKYLFSLLLNSARVQLKNKLKNIL